MITGRTRLIVHLGYPTESFKAPMIYNPWFDMKGIDAVVVPVGVEPLNYPDLLKALFRTTNVIAALVTMPHKVTTTHLVNEMTKRVDANINMLQPEELMKNWMNFGGQAQETFMRLMTAAATGSTGRG